jgi:hypothetical protein
MSALLSKIVGGSQGTAKSLVNPSTLKLSLHDKPVINRIGVMEFCGGMSPCLAFTLNTYF